MYHFDLIAQISEEEEFLIWRTRLWRDESKYDRSFVIWDLFVFIFEHCDLACISRRNKHMQFLLHFFARYLPSHHSTSFSAARNIQKLTCFLNDSLIIFHFYAVYYLAAAATMLWCCGKLDPTTTTKPPACFGLETSLRKLNGRRGVQRRMAFTFYFEVSSREKRVFQCDGNQLMKNMWNKSAISKLLIIQTINRWEFF